MSYIEIYCPFCKNRMNRVIDDSGATKWHHWDCPECEIIFEIRTMPWYPIKKRTESTAIRDRKQEPVHIGKDISIR